jgi:hypothetical protein
MIALTQEAENNPEENRKIWETPLPDGLPGLRWFYPVRPKYTSTTLVNIDFPTGEKPLISTANYGKGRVLFVATDELNYKLRFQHGKKYHFTFWRKAISYLKGGKLLKGSKRLSLETNKQIYYPNEYVNISGKILDENYQPMQKQKYHIKIETPSKNEEEIELTLIREDQGIYQTIYRAKEIGIYKILTTPEGEKDKDKTSFVKFQVSMPNREANEPFLDTRTLSDISKPKTNGVYRPWTEIQDISNVLKNIQTGTTIVSMEYDLANTPLTILLFALLITIEWVGRKLCKLI